MPFDEAIAILVRLEQGGEYMDAFELMETKHSVRSFTDKPLEKEPEAFNAGKPHYGSFSGCRNYLSA